MRNETPKFIKPSSEKRGGKRTNRSLHHNASILDRNTEKRLTANRALWAALPPRHCPSLILTFRCAICIIGFYYIKEKGGSPSPVFPAAARFVYILFPPTLLLFGWWFWFYCSNRVRLWSFYRNGFSEFHHSQWRN